VVQSVDVQDKPHEPPDPAPPPRPEDVLPRPGEPPDDPLAPKPGPPRPPPLPDPLPPPGGAGSAQLTGKESASTLAPSWLTRLSDWAALQNNQMNPDEMGNGRHSDGKAGPH
jgi:hypothetical protein